MIDKEFDEWLQKNRYEWIRAQRGHFMWFKRIDGLSLSGALGKTTSELYEEYKINKGESEKVKIETPSRRCRCHNDSGKELDKNGNCRWCGGSFYSYK